MCKPQSQDELYLELCQQGLALMQAKSSKEALSRFKEALEVKPNCHEAYYYQGLALHRLGDWKKALLSYDSALKIKPDCHEAWCDRGYTLSILGRGEEAIVSYYKALEVEPNYLEAQNKRKITLQDLHHDKNRFRYPEALLKPELLPCDVKSAGKEPQNELNQCDIEIANYDSKVEERDPLQPYGLRYLWLRRSDALMRLERYEEALSSYETAVGIFQGEKIDGCHFRQIIPRVSHNQGIAFSYLGNEEKAIEKYDQAISWHYPDSFYCRALSFAKLGKIEDAITSLDQALERRHCYAAAWYTKGTLLEKMECSQEAINCYKKVLDISLAFNNQELKLLSTERLKTLQDNHH
jgi:tetratricopeptide (TPR) repeat protein